MRHDSCAVDTESLGKFSNRGASHSPLDEIVDL
jgi:hypothetical protein